MVVHLELYVDKSMGAQLKVATGHNTCVFIDRFPCSLLSDLSVDAMDVTGEQQQDIEHKPFKQRLDKAASRVTPEAERHSLLP
ncbi:endoplasmic reticulum-Golgi intermediate compartment protein 3-like isoform X2 [Falco naumanni]|uniref:endoplasmic reticulum-Golgi intermediate compartment protein 3-like isoform X2 n=1 Tax=Falco naumanni TaxID=148594 RepID=UPI001ADE0584|nr:endoplasmic reticulum-Golgi intermediate compartment protein 3-like isoform X2 [Falco naumanni]